MSADRPNCRLCGAAQVSDLGAIADSDYFGGRVQRQPLAGGRLWACSTCDSMFRHPILEPAEYHQLYLAASPTQWAGRRKRHDFALAAALLNTEPLLERVLDIGCGTGDFLSLLPPRTLRFGLEPSAARTYAEARGIEILGSTLEELKPEVLFDAITMIDIIEHVPDPGALLRAALAHVRSGGLMVISTGDPDTFAWRRVCKARFWYVSFPEHVSFPAWSFLSRWCQANDAKLAGRVRTRYSQMALPLRLTAMAIQLLYWVSPGALNAMARLWALLRRWPAPRRRYFSPAIPGALVDHQVVAIRKLA